jgi:hypothetical protein
VPTGTTRPVTSPFPSDISNIPTTGLYGRNITFGDRTDNRTLQSTANGIAFHATGNPLWNVDMTGIEALGSGDNRQMAAIVIQGLRNDITGWRIKASDWNPISTGRIAAPSAVSYPDTVSFENCGLLVRGLWGSRVYGECVHGQQLFQLWYRSDAPLLGCYSVVAAECDH